MPLGTSLSFPVTAKSIGPSTTPTTRDFSPLPRVFYLQPGDLVKMEPDITRNAVTIKVLGTQKKVALFETPDEFAAMQALAQGATAAPNVVKHVQSAITATSSNTAADQAVLKYYNQITTMVASAKQSLPDPFVRRLVVIDNLTTGSITIYGRGVAATTPTSPINGSTAGYVIHALERAAFVAPTAATAGTTVGWRVAKDPGQS